MSVITETKAASVLGWVVKEMESSTNMTKEGVRNIDGYNINITYDAIYSCCCR